MSIMKEKYFVKDGPRNCFIAKANLKDGSNNFSNGKKNEENTENAAEESVINPIRTGGVFISREVFLPITFVVVKLHP